MRTFGLIGYPLSHSFSKGYFTEKFSKENINDCVYNNYSIDSISKIISILDKDPTIAGFNVTIPYKEKIIEYLDNLDTVSSEIGAVNTIKVISGKKRTLKGFNTDAFGFYHSLKNLLKPEHKSAIILGTGGASKAIAFVLKELDIQYTFVSRNPKSKEQMSYSNLHEAGLTQFNIIINTSPAGMFPNIGSKPDIPYDSIGKGYILYDLVYNPEQTLFLKIGKEKGATIINGLQMLHLQAERSWEIWNSNDQ